MSARKGNGYDYPEDEFDRIAAENENPIGTHREVKGFGRKLLPFLIVIVLGSASAYVATAYLLGDFGGEPKISETGIVSATSTPPEESESSDESEDDGLAGEDEDPNAPSDEVEDPASAPVDKTVAGVIFNGAGTKGLAGEAAKKLTATGFAPFAAETYPTAKLEPKVTTVYYTSEQYLSTANEIAATLGVTAVELDTSQSAPVTVVLRKDYKP